MIRGTQFLTQTANNRVPYLTTTHRYSLRLMSYLQNAQLIGDVADFQGCSWDSDDNSHTYYTFQRTTWACNLQDKPNTFVDPISDSKLTLWEMMFG